MKQSEVREYKTRVAQPNLCSMPIFHFAHIIDTRRKGKSEERERRERMRKNIYTLSLTNCNAHRYTVYCLLNC